MNYQIPVQTYCRPVSHAVLKKQMQCKNTKELLGCGAMWRAFAKVVFFALPIILSLHLCLAFYVESVDVSIAKAEASRFETMDEHIGLQAEKTRVMASGYVHVAAAEQLSLYAPQKGQVKRF